MEPYVVDVGDQELLQTTALAYLKAGIPSILIVDLFAPHSSGASPVGRHGVTIGGFHLAPVAASPPASRTMQPSRARRVDKLYVHDDQVGPFARMVFDGQSVTDTSVAPPRVHPFSMSTGFGGANALVRAVPVALIVPLYNKIRIPFSAIQDLVVRFDSFLAALGGAGLPSLPPDSEWDIYLTTVAQLKREVLSDGWIAPSLRRGLLLKSWPRFIWRARLAGPSGPVLDAFFDATDLERGNFLLHVAEYHQPLANGLRTAHQILARTNPSLLAQFGKLLDWYR